MSIKKIAERTLTQSIAEQYLTDNDAINLCDYALIEDDAAECICKHSDVLKLNGLRCPSEESAKSLGKYEGSFYQNKLPNLSDPAASSLGNNHAHAFSLIFYITLSIIGSGNRTTGLPEQLWK